MDGLDVMGASVAKRHGGVSGLSRTGAGRKKETQRKKRRHDRPTFFAPHGGILSVWGIVSVTGKHVRNILPLCDVVKAPWAKINGKVAVVSPEIAPR